MSDKDTPEEFQVWNMTGHLNSDSQASMYIV